MVKSLNEHRENIKSEVRTAARAKAKNIIVEIDVARRSKESQGEEAAGPG